MLEAQQGMQCMEEKAKLFCQQLKSVEKQHALFHVKVNELVVSITDVAARMKGKLM